MDKVTAPRAPQFKEHPQPFAHPAVAVPAIRAPIATEHSRTVACAKTAFARARPRAVWVVSIIRGVTGRVNAVTLYSTCAMLEARAAMLVLPIWIVDKRARAVVVQLGGVVLRWCRGLGRVAE